MYYTSYENIIKRKVKKLLFVTKPIKIRQEKVIKQL
jgi:hypothetical protein